jgi:hypothetical protein
MIGTTLPRQVPALSMNGGETKYFIPPPPVEAQLGRLPARHAMANPAIHRALRINVRMKSLLNVGNRGNGQTLRLPRSFLDRIAAD